MESANLGKYQSVQFISIAASRRDLQQSRSRIRTPKDLAQDFELFCQKVEERILTTLLQVTADGTQPDVLKIVTFSEFFFNLPLVPIL